MTLDGSNQQLLEDDLRALALAQPDDDDLRLKLRERLLPDPPAPKRRRLQLRFTAPALAAVAAATAAIAVALVGSSGSGGPSPADAAILHRTLAAVTGPPNTLLHVKTTDVTDGTTFLGEWWQQTAPPYASRGVKGPIGHLSEFADNGTTSYMYDASTNTLYQHLDTSAPALTDPISLIRQQLTNGQAKVTGETTINGQTLDGIRLASGIHLRRHRQLHPPLHRRPTSQRQHTQVPGHRLPAPPQHTPEPQATQHQRATPHRNHRPQPTRLARLYQQVASKRDGASQMPRRPRPHGSLRNTGPAERP